VCLCCRGQSARAARAVWVWEIWLNCRLGWGWLSVLYWTWCHLFFECFLLSEGNCELRELMDEPRDRGVRAWRVLCPEELPERSGTGKTGAMNSSGRLYLQSHRQERPTRWATRGGV